MGAAIKQKKKLYIRIKDNFTCVYCDKLYSSKCVLTVDHVYPKYLLTKGKNRASNLVTSCFDCNKKKGTLLLTEFIKACDIKITKRLMEFL